MECSIDIRLTFLKPSFDMSFRLLHLFLGKYETDLCNKKSKPRKEFSLIWFTICRNCELTGLSKLKVDARTQKTWIPACPLGMQLSHFVEPCPLGKWELKVTSARKSTNLRLLEGTLFKPWTLLRSRFCVIISILESNALQQSQSLTFATPNFSLSLQNNSEI